MPVLNTKKTNPQRKFVRGRIDFEIRGNRAGAAKIKYVSELKTIMKERARRVAKAFRNSQKKYGVEEAEVRRSLSQAIRQRRVEKKAEREYLKTINPAKK